ncbi:N(6)-adenine-specific methyltransferase METTL4-like [Saccostrea echinata]|uniref:N(6)-adenine-specific methyltransferase METTL4-like n=1 Tax=Saccostrea echinata TaxID=191078 RepID=UPI002A833C9C|nr:N(6)-adenine-specific methyltransferase METTL4-like [Saccostrea echinata]
MAVVIETSDGAFIDHAKALEKVYAKVQINTQTVGSCSLSSELFDIHEPYKMDSQVLAEQTSKEKGVAQRKRKRKRKSELNIGEMEAKKYHSQIVQRVTDVHKKLIDKARMMGIIPDKREFVSSLARKDMQNKEDLEVGDKASESNMLDNNIAARGAARIRVGDTSLIDVCQTEAPPTDSQPPVTEMTEHIKLSACVNRVVSNNWSIPRLCCFDSETYIIPHKSSFLLSDFNYLKNIYPTSDEDKYDLIVIDPPWQNKSVKRKKMYGSLRDEDLLSICMQKLATPGCLVVVWVTNRMKHLEFVKETLFPKWSVTHVAEWHWLKVTKYGEMIYDINSDHKKPYEIILIGQYNELQPSKLFTGQSTSSENFTKERKEEIARTYSDNVESSMLGTSVKTDNEGKVIVTDSGGSSVVGIPENDGSKEFFSACGKNEKEREMFPESQVIISIPCALHSVKPPLFEVLKKYLKENPRCLELFARNLWPHWTSWGNEVLCHQHIDFYEFK